jgi:hypothetical protein
MNIQKRQLGEAVLIYLQQIFIYSKKKFFSIIFFAGVRYHAESATRTPLPTGTGRRRGSCRPGRGLIAPDPCQAPQLCGMRFLNYMLLSQKFMHIHILGHQQEQLTKGKPQACSP